MLVPLSVCHTPCRCGAAERMLTPGAETSGFSRNESGVGPAPEKDAICRRFVVAPTVIADAAEPGEDTEPRPRPSKSFPDATAETTPAAAAPSIARATRSRFGAISGEFPSRPTLDTVGTVSTR